MTPGARIAAAIAVLDDIRDGAAAEKALTTWARGSRFAGSKDRAAVRDHVFDVLRAKRSLGDGSGRSLMQRLALREGWPLDQLFSGEGHAPEPVTDEEATALAAPLALTEAARCDLPDWLWPLWQDSLGDQAEAAAIAQQGRADVFLRVNGRKGAVDEAIALLAQDGVIAVRNDHVPGCLRVLENPRRVKTATAYLNGVVELQDASSQFAVTAVPVPAGGRILDYCAGGGGKALAFADQHEGPVFAHDIAPVRMRDLPVRAARAGVDITVLATASLRTTAPFDVVFCDAPCSGSGTWRRTPDAKWQLDQTRLAALMDAQDSVLAEASTLVGPGGVLAYATCSVLASENAGAVARFIATHRQWQQIEAHQLVPGPDGDGFFLSLLRRT
ncbi:MAG: RsmB/NOP family class I SAM-dependent RNA methyltransferase [Yoonia sp.]|uniref:RsmB/NOP family class I SAM-dependent RNA methyltransferase n=1 Tax=Yoonia sp. TaxID=2212373 RepID=UPI00273E13D6|nr:RsmB/NOP family class I SAM-dependent RNA methyltransferase [Yoonia sp.]MDP5084435.1 RsmB/NOP family class I SAM-dependent RNA methyltransferase [Yoonia sp.]